MGKYIVIPIVLALALSACAVKQPPSHFRPSATVKDLMDSVVDPNADFIWESVSTTVSAAGIEEKEPKTDEEWKELRRHAIALLEASNLLLVPQRLVARSGEKAEEPKVELEPQQIEALIEQDWAAWTERALALHDAVIPSLEAIDARDKEGLLRGGETIDRACEGCHLKYWYPNDEAAQRAYAERLKQQ
jgi:hypothetical protein